MSEQSPKNTLGDNIFHARTAKGLTQSQLGDLIGCSRQTISNWENGVTVPDVVMLRKLEEFLDIPPAVLLGTQSTQEALIPEAAPTDEAIVKELASIAAFYAGELEKRKAFEKKLLRGIKWILIILVAAILLWFLVKVFFYPTRIEVDPIAARASVEKVLGAAKNIFF